VTLNGEWIGTREIEVAVTDGAKAAQCLDRNPWPGELAFALHGLLPMLGISGQRTAGKRGERSKSRDGLLRAATALCQNRLRATLLSRGINEFSMLEHALKRPAEVRRREVITPTKAATLASPR
jgi:hypothetical protein